VEGTPSQEVIDGDYRSTAQRNHDALNAGCEKGHSSGVVDAAARLRNAHDPGSLLLGPQCAHDGCVCDSEIGPHAPDRVAGQVAQTPKKIAFNDMASGQTRRP
jgi:hypothetical protein